MIRCIIVEDDPMSRKNLEYLCEKVGQIDLLASFPNALDALRFLKEESVDLILLDIEMPDFSGLEFAEQLKGGPQIVFTTGNKHYALDAFEHQATDYLVKPIHLARLVQAIDRVEQRMDSNKDIESKGELFVKSNKRFVRLEPREILYVETKGDYVLFKTQQGQYLVHATLKKIESQLDPRHFVKVHRSYLVNLSHIVDIEEGTLVIGDKVIPISRAQRPILMEKIQVID